MGLEIVGDLALNVILSGLGPKDTAKVACLSKRFKAAASEECLWSKFCSDDLDLASPLDPLGNPAPSFKAAYQRWREAFGMYPWPLVKRVKRCWDRLKNWLAENFPEAKATLRKGASEADIQQLEKSLKVKLPVPTRILYRFCDGQGCQTDDFESIGSMGLIGGYSFCGHLVNVYLIPLSHIIMETKEIRRHLDFPSRDKYVVVASSSTYSEKFFFLNCTNGQLYVGTKNLLSDGEMIPCVPNALIALGHGCNSDQQQDGMLLWLEEHGRRLHNGIIRLRDEENLKFINLFPEEPPLCSIAVTNGVKIRASAVFIPELADPESDTEKYLFAYSIRMSLLPEGCVINGMTFSSCQLQRRHWIINANNVVVADVSGEAVIGMYPLLHPGQNEFFYQSCTHLPASPGSVRGSFTFVPGRLVDPKGSPFEVVVAEFPLQRPDYIF